MRKSVFSPEWDYHSIKVPDDVERAVKARGGKRLMYHGWSDAPQFGFTLFMVPGMTHCQGGPGADQFDRVAALDRWVESGTKPQSIPASHITRGMVDRTRPLCADPATAHYVGIGNTDAAANFQCK